MLLSVVPAGLLLFCLGTVLADAPGAVSGDRVRPGTRDRVPTARIVFATSARYSGDLGGIEGADEHCQYHADKAGLPGTYKAWISDSIGNSPASRFTRSPVPYRLVDGTLVAKDWNDLTDGFIEAQIGLDENGEPIRRASSVLSSWFVWTGTEVDGTAKKPMSDFGGFCTEDDEGDWRNDLVKDFRTQCGFDGVGTVRGAHLDSVWTENGFQPCDFEAHLYCVQQ